MRKKIITIAVLVLLALPVYAEFNVKDWQFKKRINVPAAAQTGYVAVKADHELLYKSQGLADVRIIDNDGSEVGYQIVEKQAAVSGGYYPLTILNKSTRNGETMFVVDLGTAGSIHNRLSILTHSENFKRQVSVYASDSLLSHESLGWRLLSGHDYVYNVTDRQLGVDVERTDISYPESTSRYVRVVIGAGEGKDPVLDGVQIFRFSETRAENETLILPLRVTQNAEAKTTELVVDLGGKGIPTHSITISVGGQNFNRRVVVHASSDGSSWKMLGQDYIFSVSTPVFQGNRLLIEYPETTARYVRVVVFNEDSQVIAFNPSATVQSRLRTFVFEAAPGKTYSLYYGNYTTGAPTYDISRFFRYIETQELAQATLGKEVVNSDFEEPAPARVPISERYSVLLSVTLVFMALTVFGLIAVYVRKAASLEPPSQNPE